MSTAPRNSYTPRLWLRRMTPRDPHEPHRAATPLELLFDLSLVVAIAQAAAHLHHGIVEGHGPHAVLAYALTFFAINLFWINFSWFGSAWDNDDVLYRLSTLLQITGSLVLAAGVTRAFDQRDFTLTTAGYTLVRIGMIANWLRAASSDPARKQTCLRYALGLTVVQLGWISLVAVPVLREHWIYGFMGVAPLELIVPLWSERAGATPWHPHHIEERYSLLVLIVIGELVLSTTNAIQVSLDAGHWSPQLLALIAGSLLLVFSMWWLYFDRDSWFPRQLTKMTFVWGYGHMVLFAAVAAVGAGLGVATDTLAGHGKLATWQAGVAVTVPVALYVLCVWMVRLGAGGRGPLRSAAIIVVIALTLASSFSEYAVLFSGLLVSALVTLCIHLATKDTRERAW